MIDALRYSFGKLIVGKHKTYIRKNSLIWLKQK
jgi:hypothetical protein